MTDPTLDLAALIGARICHDLVSPVGAIANGLELAALSGGTCGGPEMRLIEESCSSAQARLALFRVAFGTRGAAEETAGPEVVRLVEGYLRDTRLSADWAAPPPAIPRIEVQIACLGLLCVETALPRGGQLRFGREAARWTLAATGPRIAPAPSVWAWLEGPPGATAAGAAVTEAADPAAALTPAEVQFPLLGALCARHGRAPRLTWDDTRMELLL